MAKEDKTGGNAAPKSECLNKSPGPATYMLPTLVGYKGHAVNKNRGPRYTMRQRTSEYKEKAGPGPQYDVRDMTRFGKVKPNKFTLRKRLGKGKPQTIPGPGAYSPENHPDPKWNRPPVYTIKFPLKGKSKQQTPGPNAYLLPTCIGPKRPHVPSMPEYSMRARTGAMKKAPTPGPPDYGVPNDRQVKQGVPQVKMVKPTGKRATADKCKSPAPATTTRSTTPPPTSPNSDSASSTAPAPRPI